MLTSIGIDEYSKYVHARKRKQISAGYIDKTVRGRYESPRKRGTSIFQFIGRLLYPLTLEY